MLIEMHFSLFHTETTDLLKKEKRRIKRASITSMKPPLSHITAGWNIYCLINKDVTSYDTKAPIHYANY